MGCASSKGVYGPSAPVLPADIATATRTYFGLRELPLSITATASSGEALDVKAAGLDQPGLLSALEVGFQKRRFWIKDGTVTTNHGLFHASFELCLDRDNAFMDGSQQPRSLESDLMVPLNKAEIVPLVQYVEAGRPTFTPKGSLASMSMLFSPKASGSPTSVLSPSRKLFGRHGEDVASLADTPAKIGAIGLGDVEMVAASTKRQIEKLDRRAAAKGAILRLRMTRDWSPGIRLALQKTVEVAGLRVICARICTTRAGARLSRGGFSTGAGLVINDIFWLASNNPGGANVQEMTDSQRDVLPPWVTALVDRLEGATAIINPWSSPEVSPEKAYRYDAIEERIRKEASCSSLNSVNTLPPALQAKAKDLAYKLEPTAKGFTVDGLEKYVGLGMSRTLKGVDVLEFATFFAQDKDNAVRSRSFRGMVSHSLQNLLGSDKVAEFITQYDPRKQCLTVFKVFLNGVLPAGQRAGARAAAEQLLTIEVKDASGMKWDGATCIKNLRRIHLCDVVNWNSYAVLSMIGREPENDIERWLLMEELRAAGLTIEDLRRLPVKEIFAKTALGKTVHGIIKIWADQGICQHEIEEVSIDFSSDGQLEYICGEYRQMMDVTAKLRRQPQVTEVQTGRQRIETDSPDGKPTVDTVWL